MVKRTQLLASLVLSALATTSFANVPRISSGWRKAGPTPRGTQIELVFAVKQRNLEKLEQVVYDVSDPRSVDYGKHLSNKVFTI